MAKISSEINKSRQKCFIILVIFTFFEFVFFSIYGISRHVSYLTSINDLGHFDQAIWGFLKGKPFLNTDILNVAISRIGIHFDPIIAIFVPFYFLYPSVLWLIFAQSAALSLSCWPIYFTAQDIFRSYNISLMWAIILSINPFVLSAASWDFHAVTLAVPFIAIGFLALERKNFKLLVFSCFIILLCKEHFGLMIVGFGFLWGIKHKEWKKLFFLVTIGIICMVLVLAIIMPYFSPVGKHLMFAEGKGQLSRYHWLGNSLGEVVINIIKNPLLVIKTIFIQFGGGFYFLHLFLIFLGMPLFGIEYLLPGIADFLANTLSANPMPRGFFSYHSATLIPVLSVAAMYGSKRVANRITRYSVKKISLAVFTVSLILGWILFPFFDLPGNFHFWSPKKNWQFSDPKIRQVKAVIGDSASVSAQANVGAHFSQRREIYRFPNKVGQVDDIVLRLDSPTLLVKKQNPGSVGSLAHHLQMTPQAYLHFIKKILEDGDYGIRLWDDPWLVLTKNTENIKQRMAVEKKIKKLKLAWKLF